MKNSELMLQLNRRQLLGRAIGGGVVLCTFAGCTSIDYLTPAEPAPLPLVPPAPPTPVDAAPVYMPPAEMYAAMTDSEFDLPAIPYKKIDPKYYRQCRILLCREFPSSIGSTKRG